MENGTQWNVYTPCGGTRDSVHDPSGTEGQTFMDHYQTLGVSENANDCDIKKAYRHKARECHPDRNMEDALATEKFQQVQQAYEVLSNADRRKFYDLCRLCNRLQTQKIPKSPHVNPIPNESKFLSGLGDALLGASTVGFGVVTGFLVGSAGFVVLGSLSSTFGIVPALVISMPLTTCFIQVGFQMMLYGTSSGGRMILHGGQRMLEGAVDVSKALFHPKPEPPKGPDLQTVNYEEQEFILM
jgi:hypothetical protein